MQVPPRATRSGPGNGREVDDRPPVNGAVGPYVACTLDSRAGSERMEQWRDALLAARLDTSWNGTVLQVPFDGQQPGTNATLRRLVELEGSCCSFLTWTLAEQGATTLLTVKARDSVDVGEVARVAALFQARSVA